ncbi:MAG: hypothetical protein M3P89_09365 [Actinomycetota bacterium]|nr:hypothetical protein [Actinomycetota bacterium]
MALDFLVVLTAFAAVLFLPGAVVALLAGARVTTAVTAAPLVTYGLVTACTTVASVVALPWSPLTFAVAVAVGLLVTLGIRWLTGTSPLRAARGALEAAGTVQWRGRNIAAAGGVLTGAVVAASVIYAGFGRSDNPNQDWDYIFHANAVRFIADTGNIDPSGVTTLINWENVATFYPNTYHALAAVVAETTGAGTFEVVNAQTLLIPALAALGLAALLRRLGAPTVVVALTPVLLAGFASFPYDALWRGPLLPYATGIALLPAFFLLLLEVLDRRSPALVLTAGISAAALLGVQTATALSAGVVAIPFLVQRWTAPGARRWRDFGVLAAVGLTALSIGAPAVAGAVRTSTVGAEVDWPAVQSVGQAVGDMLFLNHRAPAPQYWLVGLVLVGLLTLQTAVYLWWWLAGGAVFLALFVMAASSDSRFVQDLTRPWWNDRWRFAALVVLALAPLAAHGFHVLVETIHRASLRLQPASPAAGPRRPLIAGAVLVALLLLSGGLYVPSNAARMAKGYQSERHLSAAEQEAMQWLSQHSDGGTVMNDANDGSPYMLALEGLRPIFGHAVAPGSRMGPRQQILLDHFNCLDSSQEVRDVIAAKDIRFVFVGKGFLRPKFRHIAGLQGLSRSPSLSLVYSDGGVRIYAVELTEELQEPIPACALPSEAR